MKFFLFLILTSCSFLTKKDHEISFKINQCLFYPGIRGIIIDSDLTHYKVFYKLDNNLFIYKELKSHIHNKMIPVSCTKELLDDMDKFIKSTNL